MQSILSLAFLFGLGFAATYPKGTACGTNIECNKNCFNSEWKIETQQGLNIFACSQDTPDPTQYYRCQCDINTGSLVVVKATDFKVTADVCKSLGGDSCQFACVVSGKKLADQETRDSWNAGCKKFGALPGDIFTNGEKSRAEVLAGCF